ncbi:proline-rich proteoglycan 2-like [Colius striatus]|uniref:proline-rich proteoglycan 2-like n=1 Tax=Colius striatus TaxID=57412 RepID=UPI002B1DCDE6|nr:proline-rich proteoglycan 2-like [Colius striatus]
MPPGSAAPLGRRAEEAQPSSPTHPPPPRSPRLPHPPSPGPSRARGVGSPGLPQSPPEASGRCGFGICASDGKSRSVVNARMSEGW